MSADNWAICPQCKVDHFLEIINKNKAVADLYGKVPIEEWLVAKSNSSMPDLTQTLREDYELFTNEDGWFFVYYQASCKVCGFKHSFKHEEQLEMAK